MVLFICGYLAYMVKINLANVFKSAPAKVHPTSSLKQEVVEPKSPTITTASSCNMQSPEGRTQGMDFKYW